MSVISFSKYKKILFLSALTLASLTISSACQAASIFRIQTINYIKKSAEVNVLYDPTFAFSVNGIKVPAATLSAPGHAVTTITFKKEIEGRDRELSTWITYPKIGPNPDAICAININPKTKKIRKDEFKLKCNVTLAFKEIRTGSSTKDTLYEIRAVVSH